MKKYNEFINEDVDYDSYRAKFRALVEPIENYIEQKFDVKGQGVEVKVYYEDMFSEEVFTISVLYPFIDARSINDIDKCLEATLVNVQTLRNMEQLEKDFGSDFSNNSKSNSNFNTFKFYVLLDKFDSDFYNSLRSINKFDL